MCPESMRTARQHPGASQPSPQSGLTETHSRRISGRFPYGFCQKLYRIWRKHPDSSFKGPLLQQRNTSHLKPSTLSCICTLKSHTTETPHPSRSPETPTHKPYQTLTAKPCNEKPKTHTANPCSPKNLNL